MIAKEHVIDLPMRVYIGNGILNNIHSYFAQLNLAQPLLMVTGHKVRQLFVEGLLDRLSGKGSEVIEVEKGDIEEAGKVEERAKEVKAKAIVGIGGGKVIDVAKYSAYRANMDFISVPTAPSHDGITSPFASLRGLSRPVSIKAKGPLAIIADVEVLSSAPKRLIRAGIGDTVGKLIAVRDWQLASRLRGEYYGSYTASLALLSARHALKCARLLNINLIESVRILIEALISSGVAMGMAGSTRPASGSEHLFAHAVEMLEPDRALHGELVGVGTIIMSYIHGLNWRRIRKLLNEIGFPLKAKELGISEETLIKALTIAHTIRPERFTILGDRGITWEAAEKILSETGIIGE